jgi:integrase
VIKPYFDHKDIANITFDDIDAFILSLKGRKKSNKTINHIISTLKCIFNYASIRSQIEINPCKGIKPFKVTSSEKGILTKTEIQTLFDEENRNQIWSDPTHFLINYLAAFTGLRLGEIQALRPQDFSKGNLIISHSFSPDDGLKCTKNGKSRIIPLNQKLEALLMVHCQEKLPDGFMFTANNGKRPLDHKTIYKWFWKALAKIGIDKHERERRNITFHSYRHLVNSTLLQVGMQPETIRLILGHSSSSMTAHYAHLQMPDIFEMQKNLIDGAKKNETNECSLPSYKKQLIDIGLLCEDGRTVAKSLENIAVELHDQGVQLTAKLLSDSFVKRDGSKYKIKVCKNAVNSAFNT